MKKLVRKLLPLFALAIAGGVFYAYRNPELMRQTPEGAAEKPPAEIIFTTRDQATNILGTTASKIKTTATGLIDKLSDEQEEALINSTVENISRQVKDLPAEQVQKIKYEFCKDIIEN